MYEFDVRFHTKVRIPICHVLLTVQNTNRQALLFINNSLDVYTNNSAITWPQAQDAKGGRLCAGPRPCHVKKTHATETLTNVQDAGGGQKQARKLDQLIAMRWTPAGKRKRGRP